MHDVIKVERGIYIDMGCSGVFTIGSGYFIPDTVGTEEFQADLKDFLEKHLPYESKVTDQVSILRPGPLCPEAASGLD